MLIIHPFLNKNIKTESSPFIEVNIKEELQ